MNNKFQKILIVHTWGIGDLIMLTPALKVLRENFPEAIIDIFIGEPVTAEVLEENQIINEILKFNWQENNLFNKLKFIYKLRKRKYDLAIVSTGVAPYRGSLFTFLIGAKKRVGEYRKNKTPFYTYQVKADGNIHKIQSNLNLLRILGLKIKKIPEPFFELRKEDKEFARNFIKKINGENKILFGFHPGAGEKQLFKTWNKDNFIKLGRKILENYKNVYLILFGDLKEERLCQEIKEKIGSDTFLAANLNLKQVAALINNCQIFISSDNGIAHIASTTETNLIALFGPTDPRRTGPVGKRVHIIEEKCDYPYNDLIDPKYDTKRVHRCLEKITSERVFSEIKKNLKENATI